MYTFAYDLGLAAMVGLKSGDVCTDLDYQRLFDATKRFWTDAVVSDFASLILVIDPKQLPPSPTWRQRLAEVREPRRPFRSVIVSPSVLERGIVTAINWIQPPAAGQKIVSIATFPEAVAWIETEGGGRPRPVLHALYAKARAEANAQSGLRIRAAPPPGARSQDGGR